MKVVVAKLSLVCVSVVVISLMFVGIGYAIVDFSTCVGMWLFDEGSGDAAKDSSGKGNHGKLMEGPKWVDGKFGKALLFDGKDDYVEVPHDKSLDITEAITIVAWAKFTTFPDHEQLVLDKGPVDASPSQYFLSYEPTEEAYFLNFHGQRWHAGDNFNSPKMNDTKWHHVAVTFDTSADKIQACVDGACNEHTTDDNLVSKGEHHLVIGTARFLQNIAGYYYNGTIDEVAIFNVALSEADIKGLMKGSIAAVSSAGKLAATWGSIKAH